MTTYTQVREPNLNVLTGYGWCHQYVQDAFGLPLMYRSAREAWGNADGRHSTSPPRGVYSAVFFDWTASPAGHVIIVGPVGEVYTSPVQKAHASSNQHETYSSLTDLYRHIGGLTYLGWAEIMHGHRLIKATTSPPTGQEEDEDMEPRYIADSVKKTQGTVWQLTANGRKRAIPSAEWRAIRAVESAGGGKLAIGLVAAADLKKIPDA